MFIPEFLSEERGEFLLIANHSLESPESVKLSIAFIIARISYGLSQLPSHIQTCRVIYDIRGQSISDPIISQVSRALEQVAIVEFTR